MLMHVENFKTDVIVFIHNVIMCFTSHRLKMFSVAASQVVDINNIA
jgi:hypothetical protein